MATGKKRCGKPRVRDRKPCQHFVPCPVHSGTISLVKSGKGGKGKNANVARREKLLAGVMEGKSVKDAGLEAGYSESTCEGRIYQIMDSPDMQARIQRHVEAAGIKTDEVIGTLVTVMRGDIADIFPESPILQRAKQKGVSHLIRKIKARRIVAGFDQEGEPIMDWEHEVEMYSSLDASKHLTKVFGLEQLPAPNQKAMRDFQAAVERIVQAAKDAGITTPDEELRRIIEAKMRPHYKLLGPGPENSSLVN